MRLVCLSDTHGRYDWRRLPEGDVLVIAGDSFAHREMLPEADALFQLAQLEALDDLVGSRGYSRALIIAGNHDWVFEKLPRPRLRHLTYLQDERVEVGGRVFYGYPWTPEFFDWAFMLPRASDALCRSVEAIAADTEVLISHGPPHGILDVPFADGSGRRRFDPEDHVGCELLRERLAALPRLKLCVFAHIHGSPGLVREGHTLFANVSICDEDYRAEREPLVVEV